ncbi:alpha-tocopherol transfer protein-like [Ixodes scapularis]
MFAPDKECIAKETASAPNSTLPPDLRRIAEEELGETDTAREKAVAHLRELLAAEEPELRPRTDENFLLRFIRVRKYDVEAALNTIKNYYRNRAACPSIYDDFLPSKVSPVARSLFMVLPERDVHGRLVLLAKAGSWMPSTLPYREFQQTTLMCFEHMADDPSAQTAGIVFLVDYQDFTPEKVFYYSIGLIRRAIEFLQDCLPARMKAFHAVRQSYAFNILFGLVRPFMKKKLADRIHLHGHDFENLHKEIPPSILPEEYGGDVPSLDFDAFWTQMEAQESSFVQNNSYGYSRKEQTAVFDQEDEVEITAL